MLTQDIKICDFNVCEVVIFRKVSYHYYYVLCKNKCVFLPSLNAEPLEFSTVTYGVNFVPNYFDIGGTPVVIGLYRNQGFISRCKKRIYYKF